MHPKGQELFKLASEIKITEGVKRQSKSVLNENEFNDIIGRLNIEAFKYRLLSFWTELKPLNLDDKNDVKKFEEIQISIKQTKIKFSELKSNIKKGNK